VRQKDIDLIVGFTRPDGSRSKNMNASAWGWETFFIGAEQSGDYVISVNVNALDAAGGQYEIVLAERRPAVPSDGPRLTAQAAFLDGLERAQAGEVPAAIPLFQRAVEQWDRATEARLQSQALIRLAVACHQTGNYQMARQALEKARSLARTTRDPYVEAESVRELALVTGVFKEHKKSLDLHVSALHRFRRLRDLRGEAASLQSIGSTYGLHFKGPKAALPYYHRALRLWEQCGSPRGISRVLEHLAGIHLHDGKAELALQTFSRQLEIARELGDRRGEAAALTSVALALAPLGRQEEAIERLQEALRLREATGDRTAKAAIHHRLASIYREQRDYRAALAHARSATRVNDELRQAVTTPNWSVGVSTEKGYDWFRIRILMDWHQASPDEGHAEAALASADWTFGRHLTALPPDDSPSLVDVRRELLDQDTVLLRFWVHDYHAIAWVLTDGALASYRLPAKTDLEGLSRKLLTLLTARNRVVPGETSEQRMKRVRRSDAEYERTASALAAALFGPAREHLNRKRLLISADGWLQFVPFAALPDPRSRSFRPLVMDHEVVNLPSALALVEMRKHYGARTPPERLLAVVADPVFGSEDPRLLNRTGAQFRPKPPEGEFLARVTRSVGIKGELPRLPFSRREALGVAETAGSASVTTLLGFEATRDGVLAGVFDRHRIVHIATHAFVNPHEPDLSGLVLSLRDSRGNPQRGYIRLQDIYKLKVAADLVVLSACRTAAGQALTNQGVVGLTTGLLYAGAPRVVASLWNVEDEATAELMKAFYAELLRGQGQSPAAALRAAQLTVASQARWSAPYFWAPFDFYGDWAWQKP
jgi:CHAT domain-containing protein